MAVCGSLSGSLRLRRCKSNFLAEPLPRSCIHLSLRYYSVLTTLSITMPRPYTCYCAKCLITHPDGKPVGRSTFFQHARPSTNHQPTASRPKYQCNKCPEHPPRFFLSKASYYRHMWQARKSHLGNNPGEDNQEDRFPCDDQSIPVDGQSIGKQ
jgi:hypothetical protein